MNETVIEVGQEVQKEGCCCCGATAAGVLLGLVFVLYLVKKYMSGGVYQQRKLDLSGKTAVITGGNSGIGA